MTQLQADTIGELQALLKSQKKNTKKLEDFLKDRMRVPTSQSSSFPAGSYTYAHDQASADPNYGMAPGVSSSFPQSFSGMNQPFTSSFTAVVSFS
jgi:hypothetical protein